MSYAGVPLWWFSRGHLLGVLIVAGLVLAYCLFVLACPTRRCRCLPGQMRRRCRKCKGHGRRYRRGATAIHRFAWSVLLRRLMEARRESIRDQLADRPPFPVAGDAREGRQS